ncbi:MAG TPA: flagellar hook-basal body protein [Ramlibacter sp.]|jgi:flagellar basal-body rod protein FlgG|uniref:flagellar hook-basal body protein n=1 Tax=Ramlibacter sp. TaxID=1917967 RepID=UPI002D52DD30|nr:flagellar hook-basal body protein [Ramlibacter sp.]HZY20755.1 flagellar hook-basal body protein [Ramlibacter sp.]
MNDILAVTLQNMQLDMAKVDRVALNLANAQTTGYKREIVAGLPFARSLEAAAARGQPEPALPLTTRIDLRPGTLRMTGQSLDIALAGPGWFEVMTDNGAAYTRQGDFRLDAQGRLVTQQGRLVMGLGGEIQLPHGNPVIDAQGRIFEGQLPGGAPASAGSSPLGQLKIVQFDSAATLERRGDGLVQASDEAVASVDGQTEVRQGHLENSNVSSMQEMVQLIQTMRHFESMQKAVVGYDEMLGTAIRRLGDSA